jgi:hypothetical protein
MKRDAMTRQPLRALLRGLGNGPFRGSRLFWEMHVIGWAAYGFALMAPWLGTYPVSLMLPNKLVIAGVGLLASWGLAAAYRALERCGVEQHVLLVAAIGCSIVTGFAWDTIVVALIGPHGSHGMRALGAVESGVPQFGGGLYHGLVMLTWSVSFLGLRAYRANRASVAQGAPVPQRIAARDGKRAVFLEAGEIDWIEADGDYIRVHAGSKHLMLRDTMTRFESTLPSDTYVRIHRSTIVNVAKVREFIPQRNRELKIVLRDGTTLRASRTYAQRLRDAIERVLVSG